MKGRTMYINGEFVPMPLILMLILMILTVILTKTVGEKAGRQANITWKRHAIQIACLVPMGGAAALGIAMIVANYR